MAHRLLFFWYSGPLSHHESAPRDLVSPRRGRVGDAGVCRRPFGGEGTSRLRHQRGAEGALARGDLALGAAAAAITIACGTDFYEIPIETPIQAKLDVSAFQRVLVAGFVAGGTDDVDANQETVRLLRSQLRTKSSLKVIDADIMPLIEIAQEQRKAANTDEATPTANGNAAAAA